MEDTYFTVYMIKSITPEITDFYIGSTRDFKRRQKKHKSSCYNSNDKSYNIKLYKFIRENGGFDNFEFKVINQVIFIDDDQKRKVEQIYINLYFPQLNSRRSLATKEDHKQNMKEYQKTDLHKNYQKEYQKKYRQSDKYKEYKKKYRERRKLEKADNLSI